MTTFKGYPSELLRVVVWYDLADDVARNRAVQAIEEAHEYQFDKRWTARFDKGLQPNQQDHLHVLFKGRDACIINKDGTPSHNSPPASTLPSQIRQAIMKTGKVRIEEAAFIGEDLSTWCIPRAVMLSFKLRSLHG